MNLLIPLVLVAYLGVESDGAKILAIFHPPAYSHQQLGHSLVQGLAAKGHDVTLLSPMLPKNPHKNLKGIEIKLEINEEDRPNMFDHAKSSVVSKLLMMDFMGLFFTDLILNHTTVQTFLKSDEQFDLVIIEQFLNEAFRGFCYHFSAPCVMLSTVGPSRWTNPQMGNPGPPSYVPELFLSLPPTMNLFERIFNSFTYLASELFTHLYTFRKHNEMLQKYFPGAPHLYELYYNTSLMLLNSHVSTNAPVPHVPNMIDIGGFHVNPPKSLPKDLQDYLDNAKDGAVFFSMGSNLNSKDMPREKLEQILKVFSKLKQKILWKWENETLPGQPPNVKLGKWLPQQDILAHPNVKLFITHGGLLSTIEAIYHGVPIVGIPIFGDQQMNVANAEIGGFGMAVPYEELTEATLSKALEETLNNPKYRENAQRRSRIMHDQPMKPLDKAVFWIEYVLRHDGAPHLRTAALNLTWYQYLLLDVVAVVVLVISVMLFLLRKLIKKVCSKSSSGSVTLAKKTN